MEQSLADRLNHGYQTVAPLKLAILDAMFADDGNLNHGYQTVAPLKRRLVDLRGGGQCGP